jgi:hypothetical protein
VRRVVRELLVRRDPRGQLETQGRLALRDQLEMLGQLVPQALQVLQDLQDRLESLDLLDQQDRQVWLDLLDRLDRLDLSGLLD